MRAAKVLGLFVCFTLIHSSESEVMLRGPRSSETRDRSRSTLGCSDESDWPTCDDQAWGPKCPSGCRIQGLMDHEDRKTDDRVRKIRQMLDDYSKTYESTHMSVTQATRRIRETLNEVGDSGTTYYKLVDSLNSRLASLQDRLNHQTTKIQLLKESIFQQFEEIIRLEIDIDIKIQACKGSCVKSFVYDINKENDARVEKVLRSMSIKRLEKIEYKKPLHSLKMTSTKTADVVTGFKSELDLDHGYSEFWKEIHTNVITLEDYFQPTSSYLDFSYFESSLSPLMPAAITTASSDRISTGDGNISSPEDGISITERVSAPLSLGEVSIIAEELHLAEGANKIGSSYGSHTKTFGIMAESKTKQGYIKDNDTRTVPDLSLPDPQATDPKEAVGWSKLEMKGSSASSTHVKINSSDSVTEYINLTDIDDSGRIDNIKPTFPTANTGVTDSKGSVSHTEAFSSSRWFTKTDDSKGLPNILKSLHSSSDPVLPLRDEIGQDFPDIFAHSTKVQKADGYIGKDCSDIIQKHTSGGEDGLFTIKPNGSAATITAYCDQSTGLGGWILIQQRMGGSVHFNRSWDEYKNGFGSIDDQGHGDVWLGNDNLHLLTQEESLLRIELEDWSGHMVFAHYIVSIGCESEDYMLKLSDYSGDAGDALIAGLPEYGNHTSHSYMKFSTYDRDHDRWEESCAEIYGGGWWYNSCQAANLNGIYYTGGQYDPRNNMPYEIENGMVWIPFRGNDYSLKVVRMKIRRIATN
ncbi:fibrinogen alpha chain [Callorhinchus milii]|nr:fibrinogen alpha chain [Callorhinchus milii]XP_042193603.1 fibrinogen alpha chain [Callorhinchus milii]|eukprot:gi/632982087/ref/XP_007907944.1/ PREDICTED: fibrinogen alpha chain [Callorhinchus milii]